jgi:polyisoprenyl-phosphate glycosyltransferase
LSHEVQGPDSAIELSVVAPVHDEAGVIDELARRCDLAAAATGLSFELILVDDASRDDTPRRLARLARARRARVITLAQNQGQLRATLAGLAAARGALVLSLDGDLQDPPELIPALTAAHQRATSSPVVVFAVKSSRDDATWFLAGQAIYHRAMRWLGPDAFPAGAGSYCLMTADVARRAARVRLRHANLGAVVAALAPRHVVVGYHKAARPLGGSRVGVVDLAREALGSLWLGGALDQGLHRAARALGVMAIGGALLGPLAWPGSLISASGALGMGGAARALEAQRRRALGLK